MYPEFAGIYRQWRPYDQKEGLLLSHGGDDIFDITPERAFETFAAVLAAMGVKA
jgi:hypothetical protein